MNSRTTSKVILLDVHSAENSTVSQVWLSGFGATSVQTLQAHFAEQSIASEVLPLGRVEPPTDRRTLERAGTELALFDWVVLPTPYAAEALLETSGGFVPGRTHVAAGTAATATVLAKADIGVHLVAHAIDESGSILAQLGPRVDRRERVLLVEEETAPSSLAHSLNSAGAEVVPVAGYRLLKATNGLSRQTDFTRSVLIPGAPCAATLMLDQVPSALHSHWLALTPEVTDELLFLDIDPLAVTKGASFPAVVERVRDLLVP